MKATKLIEILEMMIKSRGDLPVRDVQGDNVVAVSWDPDYLINSWGDTEAVFRIEV